MKAMMNDQQHDEKLEQKRRTSRNESKRIID